MFQFAALAAAASGIANFAGTAAAASGVFAGLSGSRKKDADRIAVAASSLQKALNGDQDAVAWMKSQATGSASAVGREAYRRALAEYQRSVGQPNTAPEPTWQNPGGSTSPVRGIVDRAVQDVRNTVGNAVSTVGGGAATEAGTRITGTGAGSNPPSSFPIDQNTMMLVALGAGALLLLRKR